MNKSLLEHLRIDQNWFPRSTKIVDLLQERFGYVPSIEKIVNRAYSELDREFIEEKGYQWIDLRGSWLGYGCKVHIFRRSLVDRSDTTKGEAILEHASIDNEGKVQNMEVVYYLDENRKVDDTMFKNVLYHELTHVYEWLQRSKRMNSVQSDSAAFRKINDSSVRHNVLSKMGAAISTTDNRFQQLILQRLYGCLYMCSPLEQNAFIAQIKSELEARANKLSDFRKAGEVIEQTDAWKNLQGARSRLGWLREHVHKEENKALIAKWCAAYFGSSVTNSNKGLKWISYELDKFERKLKSRLGKMAGEIYQNSDEYLQECKKNISLKSPFLDSEEDLVEE